MQRHSVLIVAALSVGLVSALSTVSRASSSCTVSDPAGNVYNLALIPPFLSTNTNASHVNDTVIKRDERSSQVAWSINLCSDESQTPFDYYPPPKNFCFNMKNQKQSSFNVALWSAYARQIDLCAAVTPSDWKWEFLNGVGHAYQHFDVKNEWGVKNSTLDVSIECGEESLVGSYNVTWHPDPLFFTATLRLKSKVLCANSAPTTQPRNKKF